MFFFQFKIVCRKFLFILFRLRFAIYLFSLKSNRIYDEVVQSDLYLQSKLLVVLYGKKNKQTKPEKL